MELIDFEKDAQNIFARDYGCASGKKKEMRYNGDLWMIKYPSVLRALRELRKNRVVPSYAMSSVSEWLGSHVYETLGIPVHQTLLGTLDGKIVVACKHIQKPNEQVLEFRGLLKSWVPEEQYDEMKRHKVDLKIVLKMMNARSELREIGMKERFWDMFVADIFIGNPDRNAGNWGIIKNMENDEIKLSPVYDNASSFNCKLDPLKAEEAFNNWPMFTRTSILNSACPFTLNGYDVMPIKLLRDTNDSDVIDALGRVVPKINLSACAALVDRLEKDNLVTHAQAQIHKQSMIIRFDKALKPLYEKHIGSLPRQQLSKDLEM